jgi:hypothetical protein
MYKREDEAEKKKARTGNHVRAWRWKIKQGTSCATQIRLAMRVTSATTATV